MFAGNATEIGGFRDRENERIFQKSREKRGVFGDLCVDRFCQMIAELSAYYGLSV